MPCLPQLWFDKRMQLIRLNTGPSGRRGHGLFVAFADWPASLTAAAGSAHDTEADGELDFSDFELHRDAIGMDRVTN